MSLIIVSFLFSVDQGQTFENISDLVENAIIRKNNGLQRNPHDSYSVSTCFKNI